MAITISSIDVGDRINQNLRKMKSITFTGTQGTSAATPDEIFGRLVAYEISGGDAAWDFDIDTEDGAEIYSSPADLATASTYGLILVAGTNSDFHPPVAGKIKCVINNTTAEAVVKILYEEL